MTGTVKIHKTPTTLEVRSPYNSLFVSGAKKLAGKFSAGVWSFDIRDEERVRELCRTVYGDDGITRDTCTVRLEWLEREYAGQAPIDYHGFPIARAFGRDSGAKVSEGIVVLAGGFGSSGSVKNWTTVARQGTVVLIRDFPRHVAEKHVAEPPGAGLKVTVEDERPPVDVAALEAERDRLMARLEEIAELLASAKVEEEVAS